MPSLVIKDFPAALHGRLREDAVRHHRSLTRQVIHLLETACGSSAPEPVEASIPDVVPDEVRTLFETAFPGQEGTTLLGRLMREAAEQRRHAAVAAIKQARAETAPQTAEAIQAALAALRR
jgi:plasmid stability protein